MPNDFQQWVSLVANFATIIGLFIALRVWRTWRKQQNYSFIRDKLYEQEQCLANLLISFAVSIEDYFSLREKELSADNEQEIENSRKAFELSYTTFKNNSYMYEANNLMILGFDFKFVSGYKLERIHLEAIKLNSIHKRFDRFRNETNKIESLETIRNECNIELDKINKMLANIKVVMINMRAKL